VADYVLSGFAPGERDRVSEIVASGASAVAQVLTDGVERAMNPPLV